MSTIISTAVRLLLDSSGFQAGIQDTVQAAQQATVQITTVTQAAANAAVTAAGSAISGALSTLAGQMSQINPLLGSMVSILATVAAGIDWCAVAQSVWTGAVYATSFAIGVLEGLGLPFFAAVAVVVAAAAAAVWALSAALDAVIGQSDEVQKISQEEINAANATNQWEQRMYDLQRTLDMTEAQKQVYEYNQLLRERKDLTDEERESLLAAAQADADRLEQAKRQLDIKRTMAKLQDEVDRVGKSDIEKRLMDLADQGLNAEQLEEAKKKLLWIKEQTEAIEAQKKAEREAEDERKKSDREREAAQERQRRQEELRKREEDRAAADRIRQIARETQQRAQQAEALKRSVMTPLEQYQKKLEDIENLRKVNAIDSQTADRAGLAALADYEKSLMGTGSASTAGPKLLNKGSYEDEIAKNRQQTPIEKMTEVQRQQLEEARQQLEELRKISKATEAATQELVEAQF